MQNRLFDLDHYYACLETEAIGRAFEYREVTASTMDDARVLAAEGATHGTLVLAEQQTAGRGRRGRSFQSPAGENLYFTLVLRLDVDVLKLVTVAIPLAVCRAIRDAGVDARIKWPNDIWSANDRKLCGMLIDSEIEPAGTIVFPGIGINVNGDPTQIPDLAGIASSLRIESGQHVDREALLAATCNHIEANLALPFEELARRYREVSMILGRHITVTEGESSTYEAVAVDIVEGGSLLVELPGGERRTIVAADVSVRPA